MQRIDLISPLPYFGPTGFYRLWMHGRSPCFDLGEHYLKRSYRNRCRILSANGVLNLTVPVKKPHYQKIPVKDIEIDYSKHWAHEHWHSIKSAYGSAPFFENFAEDLARLLETPYSRLVEINLAAHRLVASWLGIQKGVCTKSEYVETPASIDLREEFKGHSPLLENAAVKGYMQVFADRFDFEPNLSVLDLLFNEGPLAITRLMADPTE